MHYIIVDLEMNSIPNECKEQRKICTHEIIEIGAVMLNESYELISEFKSYVRPKYNEIISKKYERITGITTEMVSDAPDFNTAFSFFIKWCLSDDEDIVIYAWSDSDYNQIIKEIELKNYRCTPEQKIIIENWKDFQKEFMNLLSLERHISLENALSYAGIDFEGHQHDALDDAKNTAGLFQIVKNDDKREKYLQKVIDILKPTEISCTLGSMCSFFKECSQVNFT